MKLWIATLPDLVYFLMHVREEDRKEVELAAGGRFEYVIHEALHCTESPLRALKEKETVIGVGMLQEIGDGGCTIGLLLTTDVMDHKISFLKFSKVFKDYALSKYTYITNTVYDNNEFHIDYLTWLGAEWKNREDGGKEFIIRRK